MWPTTTPSSTSPFVAEAAQGLREVVVLVGGNPTGPLLTFAQGKTSVQKTLPIPFPSEGTYELRVRVTDSQGTTVDSEPVSFTLDQHPPTVALDLDPADDGRHLGAGQ